MHGTIVGTQTGTASYGSPTKSLAPKLEGDFFCDYKDCGRSFSTLPELISHREAHMRSRGRPSAHRCSLCLITFSGSLWLLRHQARFHNSQGNLRAGLDEDVAESSMGGQAFNNVAMQTNFPPMAAPKEQFASDVAGFGLYNKANQEQAVPAAHFKGSLGSHAALERVGGGLMRGNSANISRADRSGRFDSGAGLPSMSTNNSPRLGRANSATRPDLAMAPTPNREQTRRDEESHVLDALSALQRLLEIEKFLKKETNAKTIRNPGRTTDAFEHLKEDLEHLDVVKTLKRLSS